MYTLENIDGIVFDMDGVLFDTEALCMRCWIRVGERHGLENVEHYIRLCIGRSRKDTQRIITEAYGDIIDIDILRREADDEVQKAFREEGIPLKEGARELLCMLHDRGIKVGLASSTSYNTVVSEMTAVGLIDRFDVIVGGDMVVNSKPEPDIYLIACEKLGVRPGNTLAVEDSLNGIISASDAGMIPVLIPDLIEPNDIMNEKSYVKLDSLTDFKNIMLSTGI